MYAWACAWAREEASGERLAEHGKLERGRWPGDNSACVMNWLLLGMAMLVRARKLCCRCAFLFLPLVHTVLRYR